MWNNGKMRRRGGGGGRQMSAKAAQNVLPSPCRPPTSLLCCPLTQGLWRFFGRDFLANRQAEAGGEGRGVDEERRKM